MINVFSKCLYLTAVQPVVVLGLQPVQCGPEPLLLLGGNRGVGLLQQGASWLADLQQLRLLSLELLQLRLRADSRGSPVKTDRLLKIPNLKVKVQESTCSISVCDSTAPSGGETEESSTSSGAATRSSWLKEESRESIWLWVSWSSSTAFACRPEGKTERQNTKTQILPSVLV